MVKAAVFGQIGKKLEKLANFPRFSALFCTSKNVDMAWFIL
jgi:hypothetical protein